MHYIFLAIAFVVCFVLPAKAEFWFFQAAPQGDTVLSSSMSNVVCEWNFQDIDSYPGTGLEVYSLQPTPSDGSDVNNCTLYLGPDGSDTTQAPTFNGAGGSPSAYVEFDGNDGIILASSTNNTTLNTMHHTSSSWTIALAMRLVETTDVAYLWSTIDFTVGGSPGIRTTLAYGTPSINIRAQGSSNVAGASTEVFSRTDDILMVMVHDGTADTTTYYVNTLNPDTISHDFSTSSSDADHRFVICSRSTFATNNFCSSGTRFYGGAIWDKALSSSELETAFQVFGNQRSTAYAYIPEADGPTENTWTDYTGTNNGADGLIFTSGNIRDNDFIGLTSATALVTYRDGDDGDAGKMAYLTRSGSSISEGTSISTGLSDPFPHILTSLSDSKKALIAGVNAPSGNTDASIVLIDTSGGAPSVIDSLQFTSHTDGGQGIDAISLSGTKLVAIVEPDDTNNTLEMIAIDVTDDVITYGSAVSLTGGIDGFNTYPSLAKLNEGSFVAADDTYLYLVSVNGVTLTIEDQLPLLSGGTEHPDEFALAEKSEKSVVLMLEDSSGVITTAQVIGASSGRLFREKETTVFSQNALFSTGFFEYVGDGTYGLVGRENGSGSNSMLSVFTAAGNDVTAVLDYFQVSGAVVGQHPRIRNLPGCDCLLTMWQDETNTPTKQVGYRVLWPDT